jgi:hypothetical protein
MTVLAELLPVLLPIIVAGLTTVLFEKFQDALTALEKAPAIVKQVAVALLAFGLTKAAAFLGVAITTGDPGALTPQDFNALLSAGLAYLFHQGVKAKALAARVGALFLVVGLTACTPKPVLASPAPYAVALEVVADTLVNVTIPCTAEAPAVKCRLVPRATIAGRAITFAPVPDLAIGETVTVSARFTAVGGDTLRVNTGSAGVAPDGVVGPFRDAAEEKIVVIPFGIPGLVRSFQITVTVVNGP